MQSWNPTHRKVRDVWGTLIVSGTRQIEGFRKREKVCSFSAVNDSLLMWSHYGDNHRGFCIEYDLGTLSAEHFFCKNLYPVFYAKEFYSLRLFIEKLASAPRHDFRPMIPYVGHAAQV